MSSKYDITCPAYQDLEFKYGTHWTVDFTAKDGDGTVIDVTGANIQFRIYTVSGTTVMTRTVADGITVTNGTAGTHALSITAAMQSASGSSVTEGTRYLYEHRITSSASNGSVVYDQCNGHLNVTPSSIS